MAEIRTFDPSSGEDGIQQQVRNLLGENIRPIPPGEETRQYVAGPSPEPMDVEGLTIDYVWDA